MRKLILLQIGTIEQICQWTAKLAEVSPNLTLGEIETLREAMCRK